MSRSLKHSNLFMHGCLYGALGIFFALLFCGAAKAKTLYNRYLSMGLEDLMNIEVTSAFKRPQSLKDTAAAVFVITQEDIRRSGATHVADLLRMVPGVDVAQGYSNTWAVSIRGFNEEYYTSKILLLIDGRSVYSAIFPTVNWSENDIPLEEIERIEVVRGPGGAVWGANAVNGIINIITKKAEDTQGLHLSFGGGNEERGFGYLRYGGRVGDNTFYRLYLNGISRDSSAGTTSFKTKDDWYDYRGGGRVDWYGTNDEVSLFGDLYWSRQATSRNIYSYYPPYKTRHNSHMNISNGDVNLKWTHHLSNGSTFSLRSYYQYSDWNRYDFNSRVDTFDIEAQYLFSPIKHHSLMVGAGYRLDDEDVDATWYMAFDNPHRKDETFNLFIQDKISLMKDRLILTLGSKFEHNHYTDWEVQPSFRALFKVSKKISLWGAVSRAVHTPDMFTQDMRWCGMFYGPTPNRPFAFQMSLKGDQDLVSEDLWAYELGARLSISPRIDLDLAFYYNNYNHLIGLKAPSKMRFNKGPIPHLEYPVTVSNLMDGEVYGAEVSSNIKVTPWWTIKPAYTYTHMHLWSNHSNLFKLYDEDIEEHKTPQHQLSVRSLMDLPHGLELDWWLRYVSRTYKVNSYVAFDARIGWRPTDNLEISLVGRNLFDNHHLELTPLLAEQPPSEVERSVYAKVSVWF